MREIEGLSYGNYKRILFCTDFSENAGRAFGFALDAALRNSGSEVTLLHVIPEPDAQFWKGYIYEVGDMDAKARSDIDNKVEEEYRSRVPEGVKFNVAMAIGDAARVILEHAAEWQADLIVLGRQGKRRPISGMLLGSVAVKVVRRAQCPLLVVPPAVCK